jgi:hypothetical protein
MYTVIDIDDMRLVKDAVNGVSSDLLFHAWRPGQCILLFQKERLQQECMSWMVILVLMSSASFYCRQ